MEEEQQQNQQNQEVEENQQQGEQQQQQQVQQQQEEEEENATGVTQAERDEMCKAAMRDMFQNIAEYTKAEVLASTEDYRLLEEMNRAVATRYDAMTTNAGNLNGHITTLHERMNQIDEHLTAIDAIDGAVNDLEKTAILLDDYSRRLETKYKQLLAAAKKHTGA